MCLPSSSGHGHQPVVANTATGEARRHVQSKIASCNKVSMPFGLRTYYLCDHKYPTREIIVERFQEPGCLDIVSDLYERHSDLRMIIDVSIYWICEWRSTCFTAFSPTSLSLGDPSKITINVVPGTTAKLFLAFPAYVLIATSSAFAISVDPRGAKSLKTLVTSVTQLAYSSFVVENVQWVVVNVVLEVRHELFHRRASRCPPGTVTVLP
jgi:hypothetical protein